MKCTSIGQYRKGVRPREAPGPFYMVVPDEDILYLNLVGTWLRLGGSDKGLRRNARVAGSQTGAASRQEGTEGLGTNHDDICLFHARRQRRQSRPADEGDRSIWAGGGACRHTLRARRSAYRDSARTTATVVVPLLRRAAAASIFEHGADAR